MCHVDDGRWPHRPRCSAGRLRPGLRADLRPGLPAIQPGLPAIRLGLPARRRQPNLAHEPPHQPRVLVGVLDAAQAGNRRKGRLSALRAHAKAPYKMDSHRKTLRNTKAAYPPREGADMCLTCSELSHLCVSTSTPVIDYERPFVLEIQGCMGLYRVCRHIEGSARASTRRPWRYPVPTKEISELLPL